MWAAVSGPNCAGLGVLHPGISLRFGRRYFEILVDIFFGADMVLNFFTMYEDKEGKMVSDSKRISRHYLEGWFMVDLLSTVPFDRIGMLFTQPGDNSADGPCGAAP